MHAITHALAITGSMTWEITWALILGFALAAIVQAVVPKEVIVRRLGDDRISGRERGRDLGAEQRERKVVRRHGCTDADRSADPLAVGTTQRRRQAIHDCSSA